MCLFAKRSATYKGTLIAERPPHRSRRALLTHRAPPSGRTFGDEQCLIRSSLDVQPSFGSTWQLGSVYRTSFLGIGFYRDLDGQQLWTSTAQMFDERGKGLILRGARAQTETKGRHPYLTAKDAEELVAQSITAYRAHHRHVPARVVVLKTSRFRPEETEGIDAALKKCGIEMADLLWVQESSRVYHYRTPRARARDERRFQRAVTQTDLREPPGRCSGCRPHDGEVAGGAVASSF